MALLTTTSSAMATEVSTAPRTTPAATSAPILEIAGLSGGFTTASGAFTQVLDDVSFNVARNTMTAIVGETGSGKSLTMLSVIGLTPPAPCALTARRCRSMMSARCA